MHSLSIFRAKMSHGQTQTHKIHHSPDLGEATTFPLIVFFVYFHLRLSMGLPVTLRGLYDFPTTRS
jgi:hypothetical protein